ncbi:MAG: hypothetical protein QNJ33_08200 [Crocosphaera sp.]|nr:hypothetical protein [Crocosphaera sp.]
MSQQIENNNIYQTYQQYQQDVEYIHSIAWRVASTIFVQATLTAIVTETFYKLSVRYYVQKWLVKGWIKKRNRDNCGSIMRYLQLCTGSGDGSTLYSLPFQQLCGQIDNALRNQLESGDMRLIEIFANNAASEDLERLASKNLQRLSEEEHKDTMLAEERVAYYLERGLDDLQITLAKNWLKIDYIFSILISFFILECLLTPTTDISFGTNTNQNILNLLICLISGFLAPTIREFVLNMIYKK